MHRLGFPASSDFTLQFGLPAVVCKGLFERVGLATSHAFLGTSVIHHLLCARRKVHFGRVISVLPTAKEGWGNLTPSARL